LICLVSSELYVHFIYIRCYLTAREPGLIPAVYDEANPTYSCSAAVLETKQQTYLPTYQTTESEEVAAGTKQEQNSSRASMTKGLLRSTPLLIRWCAPNKAGTKQHRRVPSFSLSYFFSSSADCLRLKSTSKSPFCPALQL
jgi:hypothetical protein